MLQTKLLLVNITEIKEIKENKKKDHYIFL